MGAHEMVWFFEVPGLAIGVVLIAALGVAGLVVSKIAETLYILIPSLIIVGGIRVSAWQMKSYSEKAVVLTGILSVFSTAYTCLVIINLKPAADLEITAWAVIICAAIQLAVVLMNAFACFLTGEKSKIAAMFIPIGTTALVWLANYLFLLAR